MCIHQAKKEQEAETLFLTLLDEFKQQGRYVSDTLSKSYAPPLFAQTSKAKKTNVGNKAFVSAMARLFDQQKIRAEGYGPPSKRRPRLVRS